MSTRAAIATRLVTTLSAPASPAHCPIERGRAGVGNDHARELLNAAPDLLDDSEALYTTRNGIGVQRTARSLVVENKRLREALAEALEKWHPNDPRAAELRALL